MRAVRGCSVGLDLNGMDSDDVDSFVLLEGNGVQVCV